MAFDTNCVYPISALQNNQREVREAARKKLLRITENGTSAYVFCSEEVLKRTIDEAVADALYERDCLEAFDTGEREIREGRCVEGIDALDRAVRAQRQQVA
ncbi:hypothetical protein B5G20_09505 [Collinsella sp. An7]|uniref:hypothetical protein n=1 Tax=Collinsella sp. An7 TaxID=1965651 RepID=UPI000B3A1F59|nr:hypothetical protein [Collinsella sp. An7]OUN46097.1 hypothetical protein B5G20_09505 [Collinsella sp. An7]